MVLSVFAPFGSAILYWQMEPLNDEIVLQLENLKNKTGVVPGKDSVSLKKDWRIFTGYIRGISICYCNFFICLSFNTSAP